jgi:hypothetical protein
VNRHAIDFARFSGPIAVSDAMRRGIFR